MVVVLKGEEALDVEGLPGLLVVGHVKGIHAGVGLCRIDLRYAPVVVEVDGEPGALQDLRRHLLALVDELDVGQERPARRHVVQHHIVQQAGRSHGLFHLGPNK
jgi:hypothetical protein